MQKALGGTGCNLSEVILRLRHKIKRVQEVGAHKSPLWKRSKVPRRQRSIGCLAITAQKVILGRAQTVVRGRDHKLLGGGDYSQVAKTERS